MLNAIEAAHSLRLTNNHLIIFKDDGPAREAFRPMIGLKDWASVQFLASSIVSRESELKFLTRCRNEFVCVWYRRYLHFRRLRRVARVINAFKEADNLFLGHYWPDHKDFMRHFPNKLKHRTLYLLDDGTDTIDINNRRRLLGETGLRSTAQEARGRNRRYMGITGYFRKRYMNWHADEAERVTFFTTYDIDVKQGDKLIKNQYAFLKTLATRVQRVDAVYFLGQTLVGDAVMTEECYLEYLRLVKGYYRCDRIVYVAHPRESHNILAKVAGSLGLEVKRFCFPIEYELSKNGPIPKVIASFFSSALESCFHIFGSEVQITGFYISPEHLLKMQEIVEGIYNYFRHKSSPHFSIVRLGHR
jgi:hypothetical protein